MKTDGRKLIKSLFLAITITAIVATNAPAADVLIKKVRLKQQQKDTWTFSVTLSHSDEGWEHYADAWRVVNAVNGKILGTRTLMHPHVNEQPFTRSLSGVTIPAGVKTIYVEAHDKVHKWSPNRVKIDMSVDKGKHYKISR